MKTIALIISSASLAIQSFAASVTLAWQFNPEPDVSGYAVYYGTKSRNYIMATNVGNVNLATICGLEEQKVYYFALTAINSLGIQSAFSEEITNNINIVSIKLLSSQSFQGPWTTIVSTNVPRMKNGEFFKLVIKPNWPSFENIENTNILDSTNDFGSQPPFPPSN